MKSSNWGTENLKSLVKDTKSEKDFNKDKKSLPIKRPENVLRVSQKFLATSLISLVIFVVLGVIYLAYTNSKLKKLTAINSYEACTGAEESVIQESYPTICVTKDGRRFVRPLPGEQQNLDQIEKGGWKTYVNAEKGFSFKYPSNFNSKCCGVAGPPGGEPLISLADTSLSEDEPDQTATGRNLKGIISVYIRPNTASLDLNEFMAQEERVLFDVYENDPVFGAPDPIIKKTNLKISGEDAILIEGFDNVGIKRYYLLLPDQKSVLLVSMIVHSDSFHETFSQILSTLKFLDNETIKNVIKLPDSETYAYVNRLSILTSGQDIQKIISGYQGKITIAVEETGSYEVEFPVDNLDDLDEIKNQLNAEGFKAFYAYVIVP